MYSSHEGLQSVHVSDGGTIAGILLPMSGDETLGAQAAAPTQLTPLGSWRHTLLPHTCSPRRQHASQWPAVFTPHSDRRELHMGQSHHSAPP